jgi:hypothetical protein
MSCVKTIPIRLRQHQHKTKFAQGKNVLSARSPRSSFIHDLEIPYLHGMTVAD